MGDEAVRVRSDQLVKLFERLERSKQESLMRTIVARWEYATVCWWASEFHAEGWRHAREVPRLQDAEDAATGGSTRDAPPNA